MQGQITPGVKVTNTVKKAFAWLTALFVFAGAWRFLERFYWVRELFLFVVIAAVLTFLVGNVLLIGILIQEGCRTIAGYVRKAQPAIPQKQLYASTDLPR